MYWSLLSWHKRLPLCSLHLFQERNHHSKMCRHPHHGLLLYQALGCKQDPCKQTDSTVSAGFWISMVAIWLACLWGPRCSCPIHNWGDSLGWWTCAVASSIQIVGCSHTWSTQYLSSEHYVKCEKILNIWFRIGISTGTSNCLSSIFLHSNKLYFSPTL